MDIRAAALFVFQNDEGSSAALFALLLRGDPAAYPRCRVPPWRRALGPASLPVVKIMPDRCTPGYERIVGKMGSLLAYARARTLMSEFLPLGDVPSVEMTRRRAMRWAFVWNSRQW
jgi:hypothetical protein